MTENLMETGEGVEEMMRIISASSQFSKSQAFKDFCDSPQLSTAIALVMSAHPLENPMFALVGDDWAGLIEDVLAVAIVLWEDQPLKETTHG